MDEFFFPAKNKEKCASSKSRYLCRKKVPLFNSVKETGLFSRDFFLYIFAHGYGLSGLYDYLWGQPATYTQREVLKNIIIGSGKDKTTCGGTNIRGARWVDLRTYQDHFRNLELTAAIRALQARDNREHSETARHHFSAPSLLQNHPPSLGSTSLFPCRC